MLHGEGHFYLLQCFVNDTGVLEVFVRSGEEVKMLHQILDIYAAERVHLREGQHTGKAVMSLAHQG